jgi:hypothetical protein
MIMSYRKKRVDHVQTVDLTRITKYLNVTSIL